MPLKVREHSTRPMEMLFELWCALISVLTGLHCHSRDPVDSENQMLLSIALDLYYGLSQIGLIAIISPFCHQLCSKEQSPQWAGPPLQCVPHCFDTGNSPSLASVTGYLLWWGFLSCDSSAQYLGTICSFLSPVLVHLHVNIYFEDSKIPFSDLLVASPNFRLWYQIISKETILV